ncbi:MAG: hypothetical protein WCP34_14285, partial [Pseudomonadota bacterium]
ILSGLPVMETMLQDPRLHGYQECLARAMLGVFHVRPWATLRQYNSFDPLEIAACLWEVAEMALWVRAPQTMIQLDSRLLKGEERCGASHQQLGVRLDDVSRALGGVWGLPEATLRALDTVENLRQPHVEVVMLACALSRASWQDWQSEETEGCLALAADYCGAPLEWMRSLVGRTTAETAQVLHRWGLPNNAEWLLWPPDTQRVRTRRGWTPTSASASAPRVTAQKKQSTPEPSEEVSLDPMPAPINPAALLQERLSRLMHEMRDQVGLQRVVFALMSADRVHLKARYVIEQGEHSPIRRFEVDIRGHNLFSALLAKPQVIFINEANESKFRPLIPSSLTGIISTHGFLVGSVVVKGKPIGVFYGDSGAGEKPHIGQAGFNQFRLLVLKAGELFGAGSTVAQ